MDKNNKETKGIAQQEIEINEERIDSVIEEKNKLIDKFVKSGKYKLAEIL
jgi:phosphosulfolactate synthase (CoM biosynthesis protein A)